jgi:hypothetical protein
MEADAGMVEHAVEVEDLGWCRRAHHRAASE